MVELLRANAKALTALVAGLVAVVVTDPGVAESVAAAVVSVLVWLVSNE